MPRGEPTTVRAVPRAVGARAGRDGNDPTGGVGGHRLVGGYDPSRVVRPVDLISTDSHVPLVQGI